MISLKAMFLNKFNRVRQPVPVGECIGLGVKVFLLSGEMPQEVEWIIKEEVVS